MPYASYPCIHPLHPRYNWLDIWYCPVQGQICTIVHSSAELGHSQAFERAVPCLTKEAAASSGPLSPALPVLDAHTATCTCTGLSCN